MHRSFRKLLAPLVLTSLLATPIVAQASTDSTAKRDSLARLFAIAATDSTAATAAAPAAAPVVEASAKPAADRPNVAAGSMLLVADISARKLYLYEGSTIVRSYDVAVGTAKDPTPRGSFRIRKLVWNPGWVPPDEKWARNKTAKGPGEKGNPMKVVKIFFREPDYYIHGTG
ncbi:MAG TPA: L,D-transpeptidase, partial [Gemmatimonadaceae bacterium]|nr:L,D-transpeptidase [Gemmatimonadaceae bacterium]